MFGCAKSTDSEIEIMVVTGPHKVGTVRYCFTDSNRPETFTPEDGDFREVAVKIWYPAKTSVGLRKAPYIESALKRKERLPKNSPLPPLFFDKIAQVESNSFYGAAVSDKKAAYPIILFSHAYRAGMSANSILMEELASHGYITVSIGHAYETSHFVREDGTVKTFSHPNPELIARARERSSSFPIERRIGDTNDEKGLESTLRELMRRRPKMGESLDIWVGDISFVMDRLEALNHAAGVLSGKLDLSRIGVMGHSMGGTAAGQACLTESRCEAGVNMDGLQLGDMLDTPLEKPFMFMHHDNEGAANKRPNWLFFSRSKATAYMLLIDGTSHFNFSDLSLPFYSEILKPPEGFMGSIDGYRCLTVLNDYVRAFFDKHLCDREVDLLSGPSRDYPEVDISIKEAIH